MEGTEFSEEQAVEGVHDGAATAGGEVGREFISRLSRAG